MRPSTMPRGNGPRSRRLRFVVAAATTCVLCGASLATASADDDTPTREQVRSAQQDADQAARDVGEIKADLAGAEQNVIDLGVEAGRAAEAYNGAVYRLRRARQDVRQRSQSADKAKRQLGRTQRRLASTLASNAANSTDLRNLATLLSENGARELLEQTSGFSTIDEALAADLQRYDARKQVYGLLKQRAEKAADRRDDFADQAEQAKNDANAAVAAAQGAAADIRQQRDDLVAELAKAQGVSQSLVRERQRDLARERRQDALEEAQNQDEEQPPPDEETTPPPDNDSDNDNGTSPPPDNDDGDSTPPPDNDDDGGTTPPPDNDNDGGTTPPPDNDNDDGGGTTPPPDNDDDGGTTPPPDNNNGGNNNGGNNNGGNNNGGTNSPPVKSGAEQAIAFARAQLGEPYVWAAAGPDSWDCSGLTMQAWASAGVSLPHWSVAQYQATTPVSVGSIRRGDLLFWSNGSSSSIYHVALYLGDGMMIHAPRPGRGVEIVSIYYWIMPDLASRV